ncbi:alpha/beta fold hydrolase [Alteribacter populi]|uniref:alpha/beta fold hydrolase n=1 Tax=Alteribacter populi TaxID=2011011 RepID=UPI000BBB049E|nr:alpha/beta fold hydrolase [Alteribacter populi]
MRKKGKNGRKGGEGRYPSNLNNPELQVGQTPRTAVWKKNKAVLWHYPSAKKKYRTPLFLIYSLLNEPYILDLDPGMSMIDSFLSSGYDVYLLDFGKPGYEDKHFSLDDYVSKYIQKGAQHTLRHSNEGELSVVGYCLGGTLAVIYTALAKEPIKNLILFAPPLDFSKAHLFPNWASALKKGDFSADQLIDVYGIIPAKMVESSLRMATSPFTYSSHLPPLQRSNDEKYMRKRQLVNKWLNEHIPFAGATLKQLINELGRDNKLVQSKLLIDGQKVNLSNINANLLVVSTTEDHIVPESLTLPIMNLVSSKDKTYKRIKGGHISLALKEKLPDFLHEWLSQRSNSLSS